MKILNFVSLAAVVMCQVAWASENVQYNAVDYYAAGAKQAIERVANKPLDPSTVQALKDTVAQAGEILSRPTPVSDDGRANTFLACVYASADFSVPGIGLGGGATGMICHEIFNQNAKTYVIPGINAGLAIGWAAGAGLLFIRHDESQAIDGNYFCGGAGAAGGWVGGRGMVCGLVDAKGLNSGQWALFVGYQGGLTAGAGITAIHITKIENVGNEVSGLLSH